MTVGFLPALSYDSGIMCMYVNIYRYIYMNPRHFPTYHCRHKYSPTRDWCSYSE
jgi:hypothetical protein